MPRAKGLGNNTIYDFHCLYISCELLLSSLSLSGWSEKLVADAWREDREAACEKAGIDMKTVARGKHRGDASPYTSLTVHKVRLR